MNKVTIGIPVHNEEENIKHLLDSIKKQRMDKLELEKIIIYNDGSSDSSATIIRQTINSDQWFHGKVIFLDNSENKGKVEGLRQILKENPSKYLVLIDSDMILDNTLTIADLVKPIQKDDNIGLTNSFYKFPKQKKRSMFRVLDFSTQLLKELGKYKSLYLASGAIMALNFDFINKFELPEKITRIDAYLYLMAKKMGYKHEFVQSVEVIDTKDFSELNLRWFLSIQNRSKSYPKVISQTIGLDTIKQEEYLSKIQIIKSILFTISKYPLNGAFYLFYKSLAFINNSLQTRKKIDYLWRS